MQISTPYELRLKDWERVTHGDERHDWDIVPWLSGCLAAQAEFEAMAKGDAPSQSIPRIEGWTALTLYEDLAFYGRYGALRGQIALQERERWIAASIDRARRLHDMSPPGCRDEVPTNILAVASGRRSIEAGPGLIEPLAVALLGGVSEGRVRNLMSGSGARFTSSGGKIPVEEARAWLKGRSAYWPSIWLEDNNEEVGAGQLLIPQAGDGSVFHPALRRRNGYTIGAKGTEVTIGSFDDALAALAKMAEPRWRRPNLQGNWGIVKATHWISVAHEELYSLRP